MAIRRIQERATENLFTNTEISGTEAAKMPVGTTAQRANVKQGDIRFNSTISLMEYYDGSIWKAIDSPPTVSSISPTTETDANANIVITGSGFSSSVTVKFVGNDGTEYASPSATRNSATQITATTPNTALTVANEPYDVVVTNTSSSLSGTLADALDAGGVPAFATSAGSLGTIFDSGRTISGTTLNASATDPDGDTITYSVSAGSLPSGLSISSSTGMITGTASAVGSNTTSTFTVSAATASDTSTRQFSITVNAPVITSYTSVGSGTFSVPSGISAVDVLVVAAGGGSGVDNGGGGGAGGLIYRPAFPVTPGGSVSYTVGNTAGSSSGPYPSNPAVGQQGGQNSVFGTLTAQGGGTGGNWQPNSSGYDGGSGGGNARYNDQSGGNGGGTGTQPQVPGDSGQYGFGNPGGQSSRSQPQTNGSGAGGGGAGGAGAADQSGTRAGDGGAGKAYSISGSSVHYAYGGGGGSQQYANGYNGVSQNAPSTNGLAGQANRGGGGSGGSGGGSEATGAGGTGVVIVKY